MADGTPHLSLADFVAPIDSGHADYIGAFAATAGLGAEALARQFEQEHDDYHAIMVKALADRFAEACAEWLHARARRDWGYGVDEQFTQADLATGAIPRHSTGVRLSSLPRSQRETAALRSAGSRTRGNRPDRELRDDACGLGERPVLRSRGGQVLQRRKGRAGPGARLRTTKSRQHLRGRTLAPAQLGVRACRLGDLGFGLSALGWFAVRGSLAKAYRIVATNPEPRITARAESRRPKAEREPRAQHRDGVSDQAIPARDRCPRDPVHRGVFR